MNRKIKNATIVTYNGIEFKSQLEKRVFEFLEKQNLKPAYEKEKCYPKDGYHHRYYHSRPFRCLN